VVRKGYVEQQIDGLARALARMLALGDIQPEARLRELDRLCRAHTGLDLSRWCSGVLSRPRGSRAILGDDSIQALTAARLMAEASVVQPDKRAWWASRAIVLAAEALRLDPELHDGPASSWLETIRAVADMSDRTPDVRAALADWDEVSGHLLGAEATWLAMEDDSIPWAREQRMAFYLRLLERPDDELMAKGLPREEILEMLSSCEGD